MFTFITLLLQHKLLRFLSSVILLVLSHSFAHAKPHDNLSLNGIASFETLKTEYFIGALYLEQPINNRMDILESRALKRMELIVTKDKWRKRKFADMWLSAININTDQKTQMKIGKYIYGFTQLPKDNLLVGDKITIDYTYKKGTKVYINNTLFQHIWHDEYFAVLLQAWIGNRPPSSDFKAAIINASTNPMAEQLQQRLSDTKKLSSAKRYATIRGWKTPKEKVKKIAKKEQVMPTVTKTKESLKPLNVEKDSATVALAASNASDSSAKNSGLMVAESVQNAQIMNDKVTKKPAKQKTVLISQSKIFQTYQQNINRLAQSKVIYPSKSLSEQQQGVVSVGININRQGQLQRHALDKKTPFIALNNAAKEAVLAVKYPPLPEQLKDDESFTIQIEFSLE